MIVADRIFRRAGGLRDLSFALGSGGVTAIIGANGAGKSTLLEILAGRKKADAGRVIFADREIGDWDVRMLARQRAFLPQSADVAFDVAVDDLVALGRAPYPEEGAAAEAEAVEASLISAQAGHLSGRRYHRLSGGERQRVQLARALAQVWRRNEGEPRLLILDEPTASLDPGHRLSIMRMLRGLSASGVTVLLALHDLNDAARFADHVLLLHEGRLLASGRPYEVLTPDLLAEAYGAEVDMMTAADGAAVILFR
ncbi:ATP-binding cassette domain-containing protein [Dongia rigui]|uniref:ATP-binding cassette domain-containing protein n=1 Tax=Dongia rigui TaxID=940149 RepID=A0ABU5DSG5_9PROT|nr:ATP-binding cassette domain-containing protein [Dongia rigui]MDY0870351.1 ATP-binding cassette domain-containing protein [Dongia rigui]